MTKQYPSHFEFNEKFLIDVIDNVYSCRYGTFICNNEREKRLVNVKQTTPSLWTMMNHTSVRKDYENPLYTERLLKEDNDEETNHFLKIEVKGSKIQFWEALYNQSENSDTFDQLIHREFKHLYDKISDLEQRLREKELLLEKTSCNNESNGEKEIEGSNE